MKTRELTQSELEMLGLQSGTISTPAPSVVSKPAVTLHRKVNANLHPYVGAFVVTAGGLYGMIDDVHGDRLGFVHAEKESWTGELIDADKVRIVSPTTVDGAKALRSAQAYFIREAESLKNRISRKFSVDDPVKIKDMLYRCESWISKLGA